MKELANFIFEFFGQFFKQGLWKIVQGVFWGIVEIFNIPAYWNISKEYREKLGGITVVIAILASVILVATLILIALTFAALLKKRIKLRNTMKTHEDLIQEVNALNKELMRLNLDRDKILSMKVSQIGLNPNEIATLTGEEMETLNKGGEGEQESRFFKLTQVDEVMADYVPPEYDNDITLPEICERFRNFCCSRMRLYYDIRIIRLFVSAFACTRLIILQGISGTGKTSLPYAWGKFLRNDATICSVQPSWRDRTELFGYFNEFTKKYNETELLRVIYEATYNDNIYVTILDEMNLARIEYYFAEMLSILEMPTRDEWVISLVPNVWENDPKHLEGGKLRLPQNMWYVGTANNDDSTFAITDKVYDRAIPIDINTKGKSFSAPWTEHLSLSREHLETMLNDCKEIYKVSETNLKKIELLDDYVIEHFRLAFGNRIVKQLGEFVPAFVGCGGTEIDGIDYVLAKKVIRKFESLNLSFIRDEIDGLINYLDKLFGSDNMFECKDYLRRLQKLI